MNFVTLKDLLPLVPEIIILFTSFIVILVDLFAPKKNRMTTLAVTSLVGIGLALIAEFQLYGSNPTGFYGTVVSDPYSILFESLYLIVAGVTVFISLHYIAEQEMNYGEYYVLLLSALMGMMVMTSSLEMLVIFIGLEIMSISSYILVGMKRRVALSNEAALKYLLLGAFSTGFLLYGISLLYGATGTTYLPGIIESLQQGPFFSNPLATGHHFDEVQDRDCAVSHVDSGWLYRCPDSCDGISLCCCQSSRFCSIPQGPVDRNSS